MAIHEGRQVVLVNTKRYEEGAEGGDEVEEGSRCGRWSRGQTIQRFGDANTEATQRGQATTVLASTKHRINHLTDGWLAAERRRGERSHEMSDVEAQGGGKQEKETPGDGQPERREASARSGVRKPRGVASLERRAAADKRGRPSRISSHTVVGPSGGRWMRPSSKSASTDSIMVGWVGWAVRWRWEGGV